MPPPKPEDDDVYFIHLVADDKLVIDAALGPLKDSKLILSHEKNGGNNQKWEYHVVGSDSDKTFRLKSLDTSLAPDSWVHATSDSVDGKLNRSATANIWQRIPTNKTGQYRIKLPDEPLYWQGGSPDGVITLQSSNGQTNQLWTFEEV